MLHILRLRKEPSFSRGRGWLPHTPTGLPLAQSTHRQTGIGLREIARKLNIPEGTVLAHAKRHGWTQQIQVATRELGAVQSDAITPVQSVPKSLVAILSERKDRTKLGLSKYAAEAAEQAAESEGDLTLSRNVRDVAALHSNLWPVEAQPGILNIAVLTSPVRWADTVNSQSTEESDAGQGQRITNPLSTTERSRMP